MKRPVRIVLREWPLLAVLLVVGAGLVAALEGHPRYGSILIGLGMLGGAALRLVLPRRRSGWLRVRARWIDLIVLILLGTFTLVLAVALPPSH